MSGTTLKIDQLSEILSKNTGSNNYKIYFAGCSGSESLEAKLLNLVIKHIITQALVKKLLSQEVSHSTEQHYKHCKPELPILDIFQKIITIEVMLKFINIIILRFVNLISKVIHVNAERSLIYVWED